MKKTPAFSILFFALLLFVTACKKEYSYEGAVGILKDSVGNCRAVDIAGYYRKGGELKSNLFFVIVEVNITKTGVYKIATDTSNGFGFSATGIFNNMGLQKVKLKASGIPIIDTLTLFKCSFGNSVCEFNVPVKTDTVSLPPVVADTMELNTWHFTDISDGSFHKGVADLVSSSFTTVNNKNLLTLIGWPGTHQSFILDTIFGIELYFPNPLIEVGTYPIADSSHLPHNLFYANNTLLVGVGNQSYFYFYASNAYESPNFSFQILSYDPVQKKVMGIFEGDSHQRKEYSDYVGRLHHIRGAFYFQLH